VPGYGSGLYGTELYGDEPSVCLPVRELPPLRQSIEVITPTGRCYRWSEDEPNPANVPSGLRHSSTMPGGYETLDVTLPRKSGVDYVDLDRLTTVRVRDAGGDIIGEYRLERAPRVSGDQMAITPSAVGWQAHLDDDKSARMIYVDRDVNNWGPASVARRLANAGANEDASSITANAGNGGLSWDLPNQALPIAASSELHYAMPPNGPLVYSFDYQGTRTNPPAAIEAPTLYAGDDDVLSGSITAGLTLDNSLRTGILSSAKRCLMLRAYMTAAGTPAAGAQVMFSKIAVFANHGITPSTGATGEPGGMLASRVVAHAVGRWAPLLTFTVDETILASSFVVPHLAFPEMTTAGEIVRQTSRFELPYWGVWDYREFHWDPNRTPHKRWRARIAPAQLEETGASLERLWNSICVQYQDVDGGTRTVGPPGAAADSISNDLVDTDPDNPATQLGIVRRDLLVMGVGTAASATELGRRFLEQSKLLDTSGRARIVGHVMDDHGIIYPYTSVRAGDTIVFVDAHDTSERRIVRADHDRASRSCSIDLDAPPDGLAALLERLGVVLVSLGL
jgi:hypothetical protein